MADGTEGIALGYGVLTVEKKSIGGADLDCTIQVKGEVLRAAGLDSEPFLSYRVDRHNGRFVLERVAVVS